MYCTELYNGRCHDSGFVGRKGFADLAVLTGVYIMVLFHRLGSNPIFFGSISNSNSNYMFMYNDYHAFEQYKEY